MAIPHLQSRSLIVPLQLLFHRERYGYSFGPRATRTALPDEIRAVFAEIAPPPDRFVLTGSEEAPTHLKTSGGPLPTHLWAARGGTAGPDALPLLRADTELAGWHDLRAYLGLVRSGAITRSKKTGEPTPASVRKLLIVAKWRPAAGGASFRDSVRPYGLDAFARGAELVGDDGSLSSHGKGVLAGDTDALLEGFEQWSEGSVIDELGRLRGLKGQAGRRAQLTLPFERRERVVEALSWCPTAVWIAVADFYRAVKAWGFGFDVEDPYYEGALYIGERHYGSLNEFTPERRWELGQGSYINTVLFEVLAPLGAVDVLYRPPTEVDRGARGLVRSDDCLGLSDGLLHFRITPLGAFLFGQADGYKPPCLHPGGRARPRPNRAWAAHFRAGGAPAGGSGWG
jgi:hypothetical protein